MRRILFGLPLLFVLLMAGCNDDSDSDQPGEVVLNFKGQYDGAPLLMYEREYNYPGEVKTKFQLFHFYISDVTLLPEDPGSGGAVKLFDVALVSFKDIQDEAAAAGGVSVRAEAVPPGRYGGIRFGIGLTEELNKTQPGDYAPGHPMTDNYWSWATGYVFFKIEGNADVVGEGNFTEKLTFHIGLDDHFREKSFSRPLEVRSGQPLELAFEVDLADVLAPNQEDYVDFRQVTQDHTNDLDLARFLADNLEAAIRIK